MTLTPQGYLDSERIWFCVWKKTRYECIYGDSVSVFGGVVLCVCVCVRVYVCVCKGVCSD